MPAIEVINRIYGLLGESTVLLPLQPGTKKCLQRSWQKVKLEDTRVETYVAKLITSNIGVSLGAPSGGLCSIDFDDDEAAALFFDKNPALSDAMRTRGARGCNVWLRIEGDYPRPCKLFSRTTGKPIGEWRATGNYTAFFGKHPTGIDYSWLVEAPVVTVKYTDILWPDDVSVNEPTKTVERQAGRPLAETILEGRRKIAETLLTDVIWDTDIRGICECPGKDKHTNGDGLKDCEVKVDGVPTVYCFHASCHAEVARMNATLRQQTLNAEFVIIPDGYATVEDSAEVLYEILKSTKKFYERGQSVCEIGHTDSGPCLEPVTVVRAQATWEKYTRFAFRTFKDGETKYTLTRLPNEEARIFLVCDERRILPRVDGVVTCPILYKDVLGQLQIHNDGYNPHTRLFVANPRAGQPVPNVGLPEAIEAIRDLVGDFQFEGPAHRSRAIMSFITPALVFSGLLGGRPPVDVAEADDSQAGKGYRQKMICALYGETPSLVAQRKGGVGGLDESFQEALIRGRPFIVLDNLRGRLDSTYLEAFLTAPQTIGARGFGKAEVEVNVHRFITFASSNDLQLTVDMANRSSIVRIQKQAQGFLWKTYGPHQKDVCAWVEDNQPFYLGCVYRIVQEWYMQGCQSMAHAGHDFRWWAGRGEWIIQKLFGEAPMLAGHKSLQTRAGDGRLGWLQRLAVQAEKSGILGQGMKMHELVGLCGEGGFEPYRKAGDTTRIFTDDAGELRYLSLIFAPLFKRGSNIVHLDGFSVERHETPGVRDGNGAAYPIKTYVFTRDDGTNSSPVSSSAAPASSPVASAASQAPGIDFMGIEPGVAS